MLLYISGSFPDNQEGIASGAKVLLDAMLGLVEKDEIILLTTDIPIVSEYVKQTVFIKYKPFFRYIWSVYTISIFKFLNIQTEYDHGIDIPDFVGVRKRIPLQLFIWNIPAIYTERLFSPVFYRGL